MGAAQICPSPSSASRVALSVAVSPQLRPLQSALHSPRHASLTLWPSDLAGSQPAVASVDAYCVKHRHFDEQAIVSMLLYAALP